MPSCRANTRTVRVRGTSRQLSLPDARLFTHWNAGRRMLPDSVELQNVPGKGSEMNPAGYFPLEMASLNSKDVLEPERRQPACGVRTLVVALATLATVWTTGCHWREPHAGFSGHLDYNQDVQPILASHCFSCHGPDPETRKAGLRLDLAEGAMKKRPGHRDAIVPGHPEQSELIKRIESKDPHHLMPQTAQGEAKPMTPEESAILKEWVKEGAAYRPHWAFDVQDAHPAGNT
jgi:hypothetical protein